MTHHLTIGEAKTHLCALLAGVEAGENLNRIRAFATV